MFSLGDSGDSLRRPVTAKATFELARAVALFSHQRRVIGLPSCFAGYACSNKLGFRSRGSAVAVEISANQRIPRVVAPRGRVLGTLANAARGHWPLLLIMACFAAAAVIVPTLTPVATTDDWGYARSVEILYDEGRLTVFPVVAATAVFQVLWGTSFALIFGMTLGVLRLSSVVMMALGGVALYGILRELGVQRGRAALGVAAYLFNPLAFALAFTFMTDPHFTSMLLVATYAYLRGLAPERYAGRWLLAGSTAAGLAFLTRQQGALIPLGVLTFLLVSQRLKFNRAGVWLVMRVTAIPALMIVGYYFWLRFVNDVPEVQTSMLRGVDRAGLAGTWKLVRQLIFFDLMYAGFFTLPLILAALPRARRLLQAPTTPGWLIFCLWEGIVIGGVALFASSGRRMPYIGQFVGSSGLGPPDVLGSRPRLVERWFFDWVTAVCAIAALILGVILVRALGRGEGGRRAGAGLVVSIALWQAAGILPPSYHYIRQAGSLDRYLLPLLPLVIALTLWALRDVRIVQPIAWLTIAVFAVYSVAGARDYLVFMDSVWSLARVANTAGVANDRLDAGSAWDGYHLYEQMLAEDIRKGRTPRGPWWVYFYAKPTDSAYIVASAPKAGYVTVERFPYDQWIYQHPTELLLMRRLSEPWPPD